MRLLELEQETALTALANLLGRDRAIPDLSLEPSAAAPAVREIPLVDSSITYARRRRLDLQQAGQIVEVADSLTSASRRGYWPGIELAGGMG